MGAGEPVGVLDDALFADLDQELVAAKGADVLGQLPFRDPLLGVVLKDDKKMLFTCRKSLVACSLQ